MGFFESINKFYRGFKKIQYDVDLPVKFDKNIFDFGENMYDAQTKIDDFLSNIPIQNYSYGIKDFNACIADERYMRRLMASGKNLFMIKQSYTKYEKSNLTENDVTITVISKGLDKKVWKFDVKMFFIYTCFNTSFDIDILSCGSTLANGFFKDMKIDYMLYDENWYINIPIAKNVDRITSKRYDGYVKVYGSMDYMKNYGITDTINPNTPDESLIEDCEAEYSLEEFIQSKALVTDVVRRNRNNMINESIVIS